MVDEWTQKKTKKLKSNCNMWLNEIFIVSEFSMCKVVCVWKGMKYIMHTLVAFMLW